MNTREIAKEILIAAMENKFLSPSQATMDAEKESNDANMKFLADAYLTIHETVEQSRSKGPM